MATKVEVYPKPGETYPDADGVAITSAGAIVWASKYVEDAIRDGFLLTYDPYGVGIPDDRTDTLPPAEGAPSNAPYVLTATTADLPDARVLTAGTGISVAVGGPGGAVVVSATGVAPPVDAEYLVAASHGTLTAERVLTAGAGIALTPTAGALAVSSTVVAPAAPIVLPPNVAASSSLGTPGEYATAQHTHGHGDQAGGSLHALATTTVAGFVSGAEKVKIAAIPAAGAAPADAQYLVSSASAGLSAERVLTAGAGISLTPGAGTLTVAASGPVSAPVDAEYLVGSSSAVLSNEKVLTAGPGIVLTPGGGTLTIEATAAGDSAPADAEYLVSALSGGLTAERVLAAGAGVTLTPGTDVLTVETPDAVQGPASATDTAIALFDGATGKLIKESLASIDHLGNITTGGTVDGVDVSNLAMALALVAVPDYVTLSSTPTLGNERILAAGAGISITDDGPGGAVTVASTVTAGAPVGASYLTLGANATLTSERVLTAGPGIALTDGGAGGPLTVSNTLAMQNSTAPYTLVLADAWKFVGVFGAAPSTLLVPNNTAVAYPLGTVIHVAQSNSGQVTLAADAGVQVISPAGYSLALQGLGSVVTLIKTGTNQWFTFGDFTPTASFLTLGVSANLANERVLTQGPGIALDDAGAGGALTVRQRTPTTTQTGTAYALTLADANTQIGFFNAAPVSVTIPAQASVAFLDGTEIFLAQTNLGTVSITLDTGVQLLTSSGQFFTGPLSDVVSISGRYSVCRLFRSAANQWFLSWGLAPYVNTTAAAALTLTAQHSNNIVTTTSASAVTITLPVSTAPVAVGCRIAVHQLGAGQVTVAAGAGVTLNVPSGFTAKTRNQYSEVMVTQVSLNTWEITGDLEGGAALLLNNQTGTAYTLVLADAPKCVTMSNAAANTLTIPANASVAFPIGTVVTVMQLGVGQTTVAITTDTLLNPALTAKLRARYSVASITKITATSWVLSGDLAAV